jgi:hypothetical protein
VPHKNIFSLSHGKYKKKIIKSYKNKEKHNVESLLR